MEILVGDEPDDPPHRTTGPFSNPIRHFPFLQDFSILETLSFSRGCVFQQPG
jgi:hypothetical protein